MPEAPACNTLWRHRKGGLYVVHNLARGCGEGTIDGQDLVIYSTVGEAKLWVRPLSEFMDGRFQPEL